MSAVPAERALSVQRRRVGRIHCSTTQVRRIKPGVFLDPTGAMSFALDFSAPYASSIVPGANLNFQFWYRDAGSSNLSDSECDFRQGSEDGSPCPSARASMTSMEGEGMPR